MTALASSVRATLVLGAMLMISGCTRTVTTARTVTPEEYSANSWVGRMAEDVTRAWGENDRKEPDGRGGYTVTFSRMASTSGYLPMSHHAAKGSAIPGTPNSFQPEIGGTDWVSTPNDLAKFWVGADGKIYRFWFADEVYKKGLDSPRARPVEAYGSETNPALKR